MLYVADGLRADSFYECMNPVTSTASAAEEAGRKEEKGVDEERAGTNDDDEEEEAEEVTKKKKTAKRQTRFLRRMIEDVGSWGVSHTRVPTESRFVPLLWC